MKNKIIKILKWSLLIAYLIVVMSFVDKMRTKALCSSLRITVNSESEFIDSADVNKLLTNNKLFYDSIPLSHINFELIEKTIKNHSAVRDVQVYSSYEGKLIVSVVQRVPIVRVIPKYTSLNNGFYIDDQGKIMPLSEKYTAHVPVITGEITPQFISSIDNDSVKNRNVIETYHFTLYDLYHFVSYIHHNELWSPQFEQININANYEVELVPRVGNHIIVLGDLTDYEYKLFKLEAMYYEGFKHTDWNSYKTINLKYANQIVCTK
ncbi:MAG: hypothetical protein KBB11_10510 [Bacteroidales bacterium]|nr:hypothetical protein [Bacteroidales bacterium]HOY37859.1 hypothetical protein [Bacteroidales bacterium]HQP03818.1 hypothetical protein [Bacteroidales bacterium]